MNVVFIVVVARVTFLGGAISLTNEAVGVEVTRQNFQLNFSFLHLPGTSHILQERMTRMETLKLYVESGHPGVCLSGSSQLSLMKCVFEGVTRDFPGLFGGWHQLQKLDGIWETVHSANLLVVQRPCSAVVGRMHQQILYNLVTQTSRVCPD